MEQIQCPAPLPEEPAGPLLTKMLVPAPYKAPKKGPNWSSSNELSLLQTRVKSVVDKDVKLVDVVQVMLVRLVLPCQRRACSLWEFDPTEHQTLRELYDSSHKDIWKVFFMSDKSWPGSAEDRGYQLSHSASPAIYSYALSIHASIGMSRGRHFHCALS